MPFGGLAAGAASGIIGGIAGLFGTPKTSTTTTTPTFSTAQNAVQSDVSGTLQNEMNNPANLQPLQTAAASQVDQQYKDANTSLTASLAAKGFGNSGKLVTNTKNLAIAQAGAQGSLASQFAGMQIDQNNNVLNQAEKFGFADPGSTSVTNGTTGGGVGGAVDGAAGTASMMYTLNHLMGGGGSVGDVPGGTATGNPALSSAVSGALGTP